MGREPPRPWQSLLWAGSPLPASVSLLTDPPWASVSPSVEGHLACPRGPVTMVAFLCFSHHLPETPKLTHSSSHSLGRLFGPCPPGWASPLSPRQLSICTCNGGEGRESCLCSCLTPASCTGAPSCPQPAEAEEAWLGGRGKGCWCPGDPGWGEGSSGPEAELWAQRKQESAEVRGEGLDPTRRQRESVC